MPLFGGRSLDNLHTVTKFWQSMSSTTNCRSIRRLHDVANIKYTERVWTDQQVNQSISTINPFPTKINMQDEPSLIIISEWVTLPCKKNIQSSFLLTFDLYWITISLIYYLKQNISLHYFYLCNPSTILPTGNDFQFSNKVRGIPVEVMLSAKLAEISVIWN